MIRRVSHFAFPARRSPNFPLSFTSCSSSASSFSDKDHDGTPMSRREVRESDSKRYRSRFDREPSPKRSRRDRKPLEEKLSRNTSSRVEDNKDRDQKHELRHREQDMIPHESSLALDSKPDGGGVSKEANRNSDGRDGGTKHSLNPTEVPRPRSYFQHDERGNAGQVGRSFGRSATGERGWWKDSKDQDNDRASGKTATHNSQQRDEIPQTVRDDNHTRHRDGFLKLDVDATAPARKRPAFREKKITVDSGNVEKVAMASESKKSSDPQHPRDGREWRDERGGRDTRYSERLNKHATGDMAAKRDEMRRGGYPVRDRYGSGGGGGGNYRGRDRFGGRQGYRASGTRVEKWKHDLYHEANRSPTPKNEEDQVAKVEALLAS